MIDHAGLKVRSYEKSRQFYAKALEPLGYSVKYEDAKSKAAGFGAEDAIDFWIAEGAPASQVHIAFRCGDREVVKRFHAAATGAGGKDNGAAGLRADYGPTYYAAFVLDPDGNNIETVCHEPA
jgi:catechol 2,3-dioxygenase-like lactoylglutathione lyase family enzyme